MPAAYTITVGIAVADNLSAMKRFVYNKTERKEPIAGQKGWFDDVDISRH
ncbi:hypothetical protein [Geobacillus sp. BMUD]|nr:hypothetical protein [Geobacillus sp. BMUD]